MRRDKVCIGKYATFIFIEDKRLPNNVIEFRHPKTGKLIGRIINIGSIEE